MISSGESADHGTVPEEVLADLLDSRRRCHLLAALAESDGEALVEDLVAAVGATEENCAPSELAESTLSEVRTEVFERHVPRLTAIGVVEYDSMLNRLRLETPEVASRAADELTDSGGDEVSSEA